MRGSYNASVFSAPVNSNIFVGLLTEILVCKTVLYLIKVCRSLSSDTERHFCSESKKFVLGSKPLSKNLFVGNLIFLI